MNLKILIICLLYACSSLAAAQDAQVVNQTDKYGKKQGHWIKKYPNGNVMYDGFFRNDKPAGEFRRYYEDNTLKSLLVFNADGAEATCNTLLSRTVLLLPAGNM